MNNLFFLIVFCCFCQLPFATAQWNPNAGYIPSLTDEAISVSATSGPIPDNVLDGNYDSNWQSAPPLPQNFISRPDQNIFLHQGNSLLNSPGLSDFTAATDSDLSGSVININFQNNMAVLNIDFPLPQTLLYLALKANASANIHIYSFSSPADSVFVGTYSTLDDNYSTKGFLLSEATYTQIKLYSNNNFQIFEISALAEAPKESVIVDLGAITDLGTISAKHWAGSNTASETRMFISNDATNWTAVADLDPNNPLTVQTFLPPGTTARFIKIEHTLLLADYNSVYIWEIQAYDSSGQYGPFLPPQPGTKNLRNMVGINAIWGWGHGQFSNNLLPGEGPDLHNAYATHARNYHFMNWDVTDPDIAIDFADMAAGNGTQAQSWLNWDTEYQAWVDAGLDVQATIQFGPYYQDVQWDSPFLSAYNYGYAFAEHFGPTNGNGLVKIMEVGNEPWYYNAAIYRQILEGMASGAKAADPAMEVFPCALQAYNPYVESATTGFKNYMGARITEAEAPYLDGINIHNYSFVRIANGEQIAVHPEHPGSQFNGIRNAIRFRDANMPGKQIFLSEVGWDSNSANEDCTHSECISEEAAAVYVPRSAMIAQRYGLDRISFFFFGNDAGASTIFNRSGLTESATNDFNRKKTFVALQSLVDSLGSYFFLDVFQEDEGGYVYLFGLPDGTVTHLAGWLPVDGDDNAEVIVEYPSQVEPLNAFRIDGENEGGTTVSVPPYLFGKIKLTLNAKPLIVRLNDIILEPCVLYDTTYVNDQTCDIEEAGVREFLYANAFGCDSLVIRTMELLPNDTTFLNEETCDPILAGNDSIFMLNQYGCDSIIVTTTQLNPSDSIFLDAYTCDMDKTGTAVEYFFNRFGCDSTVFTTTHLLPNDTLFAAAFSCDPSDAGPDTLVYLNQNPNSCFIYLITQTEVFPSDTIWFNQDTCDPNLAGQEIETLQNQHGCDSIIVTNINLLPSDTIITTSYSCNLPVPQNDTLSMTNQYGCDSIMITQTIYEPAQTVYGYTDTCNPEEVSADTLFLYDANGCDFLVITETVLLQADTVYEALTTCSWLNAGTDTLFLTNQHGCDSMVVQDYAFVPDDIIYQEAITCNPQYVRQDTMLLSGSPCDLMMITNYYLMPEDLYLDNPVIEESLYQASNSVRAEAVAPANNQVVFKAGNFIDLLPGFEVEPNCNFEATISPCEDDIPINPLQKDGIFKVDGNPVEESDSLQTKQ